MEYVSSYISEVESEHSGKEERGTGERPLAFAQHRNSSSDFPTPKLRISNASITNSLCNLCPAPPGETVPKEGKTQSGAAARIIDGGEAFSIGLKRCDSHSDAHKLRLYESSQLQATKLGLVVSNL